MSLDVEIPDAPPLHGPQSRGEYAAIDTTDEEPGDDHRREEVATALEEGAWHDAFEEWAEHTYLSESEFETAAGLGLFGRFDFYWDPSADDVGYRAPTVASDERGAFDDVQGVDNALDSLGRVVSETLENDYLVRGADDFGFFADEDADGEVDEE